MRVSIFGLGMNVGAVSAGCFARQGHEVIGVDPVAPEVDLINSGRSPVIEAEIDSIIETTVREGRFRAVQDTNEAIQQTELSFICVGTPSHLNGNLDLTYIRHVCEHIGAALRHKKKRHVVVVRSTVLPGTTRGRHSAARASSGKKAGVGFGVCTTPSFCARGRPSRTSTRRQKPSSASSIDAAARSFRPSISIWTHR